jgi:hypothetical protein
MYPRIGQFDGVSGPDGESSVVNTSTDVSPATAAPATTSAIGANRMAQASYGGGTSTPAKPAKAAKPINKSNWDRSVKVSQSTVDSLKKGGIKQAAAMSKLNAGAAQSGLAAEYQEATKRVYPSAYTASSTKATKPSPKVDNAPGTPYQVPNTPYGFGGFTQSPNKPKAK